MFPFITALLPIQQPQSLGITSRKHSCESLQRATHTDMHTPQIQEECTNNAQFMAICVDSQHKTMHSKSKIASLAFPRQSHPALKGVKTPLSIYLSLLSPFSPWMLITSLSSLSKVRRVQTVSTGHITTQNGISPHAQRFAKGYIVYAMAEYLPAH